MNDKIIIEIHSEPFQKVLASFIGIVFGGTVICSFLCSFLHIKRFLFIICNENYGPLDYLAGLALFIFAFWIWWSTLKYKCYVTDEGIGQRDGFRHKFIKWETISSYTMEQIPMRKDRCIEPILRNAESKILMKPMIPVFMQTLREKEKRSKFWRYVTDRIDHNLAAI